MNGIVFSISFLVYLSLACRKATIFFCVCVSFVSFYSAECVYHIEGFMVESLGSFIHGIISSANKGTFTSFFPTCISFLSPSCHTVLAKTSS